MLVGSRAALAIALLGGAAIVQGCSTRANLLAAIDGPYIPPSERAEAAYRAVAEAPAVLPRPRTSPAPASDDPIALAAPPAVSASATPRATPVTAPAGDPGDYAPFFDHALSQLRSTAPAGTRRNMVLSDPPSLQPDLLPCGNRPPAVLIDLDPATGLFPLAGEAGPAASLGGFLARLRDEGVTVHWITGHAPSAAQAIRTKLRETGLDAAGLDPLIVSRFAGESKQDRRLALGETHCLLAIAGDSRSDFDELYDFIREPLLAAPLEELVGNGWFLVPPPID